ncbi:transcription factor of the MADS box [Linnemannia gamsii]|uniref:Transcription factor of the MADS box n=1 Tax=Linnemannia gamsii TaxID=64522 RepID=A0A9P6UJ05_9FUNG|nr:transcription factor of the MADS box [Linnemannia gamsii]
MSAKRNQAQSIGSPTSSTGNGEGNSNGNDQHLDKKFKVVHGDGDGDEDEDDDDDDDAPKSGKRAGRRKIKIEYIEDKSRRHITFSKRKSGIMKKAFELSTLTGTQVLLLVVSETGLVYTFTTPKLQPLVTKAEGKNLIQACLHAPDKETSPEAQDQASPEATPAPEYEDPQAVTPQSAPGASQGQSSPPQPSPQQQQQQYQQQQQQQQQHQQQQAQQGHPPPPLQGQPSGGYGSSSAMSVPSYPHPYSHIPFPSQYNYPAVGLHYQNAPPNAPPNYGGNQYWSGPPPPQQQQQQAPPQQQPPQQQPPASSGPPQTTAQLKGGRKTEK